MISTEQVNKINEDETREYHLKKLFELSLKSIGEIPQLEEPNQEQKEWFERRMKGSARSSEVWNA
jgi:hypothetical protein